MRHYASFGAEVARLPGPAKRATLSATIARKESQEPSTAHAVFPQYRPDRVFHRPARRALVRHHVPARLRAAPGGSATGVAQRDGCRSATDAFSDLAFYVMLGVILGGRIWYMLFYVSPDWIVHDPLALFRVWEGGMSFHGGLLGVLVAGWLWSRRNKLTFFRHRRFRRAAGADRPRPRPSRQFHQRRAVGQAHRCCRGA